MALSQASLCAALLAVCLCVASLGLVSAAGELYAVNPPEMADDFNYKNFTGFIYGELSLFGVDRDEAFLEGRLNVDVEGNEQGCARYADGFLEPLGDYPVSVFALVSRGGCSFGQKAYYAQRAGASGMIVYNLESGPQFPLPHMTAGNVSNIDIPGMLINHQDGQTLLGHVKQWQFVTNRTGSGLVNESSSYYEGAWLSLTYSMVQPDDHVEWDLYTSPDQVNAAPFLQSFAPVFEKLSERTSFTPHYRVVDGSTHGCTLQPGEVCSEANKGLLPCGNQCTNCGRYCLQSPTGSADLPPLGQDQIVESVLQKCLWQWGSQNAQPLLWWKYVEARRAAKCGNSTTPAACNEAAMTAAGVSAAAQTFIATCRGNTGAYADVENDLLESELEWAYEWVPASSPALFVNEFVYSGSFTCPAPASVSTCEPMGMICRAFVSGSQPAVCSASGCEGGADRDACGVCGGSTRDAKDCDPKSKGFPLGGIIAIVIACFVLIGAGAACYLRAQNRKLRERLDQIQEMASERHEYAAPPVRSSADTAHSAPNAQGQFWQ